MSKDSTTFVGLDVHKDSITVACVGAASTDPVIDLGTIGTQQYAIERLIRKLSRQRPLRLVYEAGPCGSWLLRNDIRYTGQANWSAAHRRWLSELVLPSRAQQIVCQELIDAVSERERRRDRIEAELDRLAPEWDGDPLAQALQAFRGIQKTVAYTVIAEAGDLGRFAHPRHFMAWLGLVPSEHSSGTTRRQGPITRCGNRWARTLLVEAAWAYRYHPKVSAIIERRAQTIDPQIRALAWKAQLRLTARYRRLAARGKHHNVVITAIARELAAFIWAAARLVKPATP